MPHYPSNASKLFERECGVILTETMKLIGLKLFEPIREEFELEARMLGCKIRASTRGAEILGESGSSDKPITQCVAG
jgi:hypothetical protein